MYPDFKKISVLADLAGLLSNSYTPPEVSILKQNTRFLFRFLTEGLEAKYFMIENDYFSQSYFDDYKFFHVNSYKDFSKTCQRVHFFSSDPPEVTDLSMIFNNDSTDPEVTAFWRSYLGYIVVRPIPIGIIGATLLKSPVLDDEFYTKKITVKINNAINIFGYQFTNFETLIYQEQDKIVGACATASLWSALDRAHHMFGTPSYSPSRLTQIAGKSIEGKIPQRRYPNTNGLTLMQITHVLEELSLDYEIAMCDRKKIKEKKDTIQPTRDIKDFIYAYIRYGIPMILAVEFSDEDLHSLNIVGYKEPKDKILLHAIVSSYKVDEAEPIYKAHLINEFYVHDDQLGPFAPIDFENINEIKTQWDEPGKVKFYSALAIIHPTWIIDTGSLKKHILILHELLKDLNYNTGGYAYWDYYLIPSNEWKNNVKREGIVLNSEIIYQSLPQYIWVIEYYRVSNSGGDHRSELIFSLLIDTTSLSRLSNIIDIVLFDDDFRSFISEKEKIITGIEEFFREHIQQETAISDRIPVLLRKLYLLKVFFGKILESKGSTAAS